MTEPKDKRPDPLGSFLLNRAKEHRTTLVDLPHVWESVRGDVYTDTDGVKTRLLYLDRHNKVPSTVGDFTAMHDPAFVDAYCTMIEATVELWRTTPPRTKMKAGVYAVMVRMVQPYSDRNGFRKAWRDTA